MTPWIDLLLYAVAPQLAIIPRDQVERIKLLKLIQIGLNTSDIAGSLRLFSEAFGFQNAGGQAIWGSTIRIQGLDARDRAMMWWMVGGQPFFQLEFYNHSQPAQRAMPTEWRAVDHGWVRFGVTIDDFDACLGAIEANGVALLAPPTERDGTRRAAFRDPFVGIIVEVIEKHSHERGGIGPEVAYVTSSVSDVAAAKWVYEDVLGLSLHPLDKLHAAGDESLWGVAAPKREGFVAEGLGVPVEVVCYSSPAGRPRPADYRISDQGMCNVAVGSHDSAEIELLLAKLGAAGVRPPHVLRTDMGVVAAYIKDAGREIEFAAIPAAVLPAVGFTAVGPFLS